MLKEYAALQRSDAELVEAACQGDIESFRELYVRHYRMAVGIARSRLSDAHLAEDAAQEAFATACGRLYSLRDWRRFPEWLGTICRRTASRMARSRPKHAALDDAAASTSANCDEQKTSARLRAAVDRLPRTGREVILLHYFSGLSYDQIARALGITTQAVHGRLQRARRTLTQDLSEDDE